jgi:hypothetical protein
VFFVSVASKDLTQDVSLLFATLLAGRFISVAAKGLKAIVERNRDGVGAGQGRRTGDGKWEFGASQGKRRGADEDGERESHGGIARTNQVVKCFPLNSRNWGLNGCGGGLNGFGGYGTSKKKTESKP